MVERALLHHSNLRLPIRLERALDKLLVTPRMHGIHHSHVRSETNSSYGVVFPWWDRLHRTLGLNVPQAAITIGVPGYSNPEDNRLRIAPFRAPTSPRSRLGRATSGCYPGWRWTERTVRREQGPCAS